MLVFSCAGYSADCAICKFLLAQQAVDFPEGSKLQHFGWQGQLQDVLVQLELSDLGIECGNGAPRGKMSKRDRHVDIKYSMHGSQTAHRICTK